MKCDLDVGFAELNLLVTGCRPAVKKARIKLLRELPLRACLCDLLDQTRIGLSEESILCRR